MSEALTLIKLKHPDPYEDFSAFYKTLPDDFKMDYRVDNLLKDTLYFYYKRNIELLSSSDTITLSNSTRALKYHTKLVIDRLGDYYAKLREF